MDAVFELIERKNSSQFLLKLGNDFNEVARNWSLTDTELFSNIFDHILSASTGFGVNGAKLLAVIKYPDPRVTLLCVRKNASENIEIFKQNFVTQAVHYFTNTASESQKSLELIMSIERLN